MAATGSTITVHENGLNRITIRVPAELKSIIVRDADLRGGWGQVNKVVLEILAKHYDRMDLAYVPKDGGERAPCDTF